jgi:hypothetical protein
MPLYRREQDTIDRLRNLWAVTWRVSLSFLRACDLGHMQYCQAPALGRVASTAST